MKDKNFTGVIDIGSNSVRLCVCELQNNTITPVLKHLITTRLYKDISKDYCLDEVSILRTIDAIKELHILTKKYKCDNIFCYATAALRVANNRNRFIALLKSKTNLDIDILSEEREAQVAFIGVGAKDLCGVIDIGGASTEIAIGINNNIVSSVSMKMGAVKASDLFKSISKTNNIDTVTNWAKSIINTKAQHIIKYIKSNNSPITFYGVGGTITTMSAMQEKMIEYSPEAINSIIISKENVLQQLHYLHNMNIKDRYNVIGLPHKRADIIIEGLCILLSLMEVLEIDNIRSSDNDNLLGYMKLKTNIK